MELTPGDKVRIWTDATKTYMAINGSKHLMLIADTAEGLGSDLTLDVVFAERDMFDYAP